MYMSDVYTVSFVLCRPGDDALDSSGDSDSAAVSTSGTHGASLKAQAVRDLLAPGSDLGPTPAAITVLDGMAMSAANGISALQALN